MKKIWTIVMAAVLCAAGLLAFPCGARAAGLDEETRQGIYSDLKSAIENREDRINLGFYALPAEDQEIQRELVHIFRQVLCDNPMLFYVSENTIRLTTVSLAGMKFLGLMKYEIAYSDEQINTMTAALKNELDAVRKTVAGDGRSEWAVIKGAHDYIVSNVPYDKALSSANNNNAYGALVEKKAVCYGYAKAYILILQSFGYGCDIVYSEKMAHAWNAVQYQGNWYHADLTWDAQKSSEKAICYEFFMKSDKEFQNLKHYEWRSNVACTTVFKTPEPPASASETETRKQTETQADTTLTQQEASSSSAPADTESGGETQHGATSRGKTIYVMIPVAAGVVVILWIVIKKSRAGGLWKKSK